MKKITLLALHFALASTSAFAWSGYDYENNTYVDIDKGNLVRSGSDIEIYDHREGEYRNVRVESIRSSGSRRVEVEVTDQQTGDIRTLEMDRD